MEETKKKRKWYKQNFNPRWLEEPEFKDWLEKDPVEKTASYCKVCHFTLTNPNRSSLNKHMHSTKHKKRLRSVNSVSKVSEFESDKLSAETEILAGVAKQNICIEWQTGNLTHVDYPTHQSVGKLNEEELIELKKGKILQEGKTKQIFNVDNNNDLVIIESKDAITAFDGERADTMQGKAEVSTSTNSHVFKYLNQSGIRTSFIEVIDQKSFLARKCRMIPLEFVARRIATGSFLKRNPGVTEGFRFRPIKLETFFKDDANKDPQWSEEQILESKITVGEVVTKITKTQYDILMKTTKVVFEILERAWQSLGCTLVDMKVEYGFDAVTGEILLSDVIDSDSWRLWPSGDKRLMKDKQVYRNLKNVTPEALETVKRNFIWVETQLRNIISKSRGMVVILMGSKSDEEFAKEIKSHCSKFNIDAEMRVSSAHKSTDTTMRILAEYEDFGIPLVFIAVAGRSNGLGPVLSGNTNFPVINCPPPKNDNDIWSSLRTPSGLGCSTVLYPEAAALQAASILGLNDHQIWSSLRGNLLKNWKKILLDDENVVGSEIL